MTGYCVMVIGLMASTLAFHRVDMAVLWLPATGASLALVLRFGASALPLVLITRLVGSFFLYDLQMSDATLLAWAAAEVAGYGLASWRLRRRAGAGHFQLKSVADITWFLGLSLAVAGWVSLVVVTGMRLDGSLTQPFGTVFSHWWLAESVGLLVTGPLCLALLYKLFPDGTRRELLLADDQGLGRLEVSAIVAALLVVQAVIYQFGEKALPPVFYLSFLPVIWLTVRGGVRGALVGTLALVSGVAFASQTFLSDLSYTFELQAFMLALSGTALYVGALVGERGRAELLITHDLLTGLHNRAFFNRHLDSLIHSKGDGLDPLSVILVDIDNMGQLNDSLGHAFGDSVLIEVSRRVVNVAGEDSLVARYGQDEFVVLAAMPPDRSLLLAEHLLYEIRTVPFMWGERHISVTASIGVAVERPGETLTSTSLQLQAEFALRRARDDGLNRVRDYNQESLGVGRTRLIESSQELRNALDQRRLELHAQPVVDLTTRRVRGYELLTRLRTEDGQVLSPTEVFAVADWAGMVGELDAWVIEEAMRVAVSLPDLRFGVNVSPRTIRDLSFVDYIAGMFRRYRVESDRFIFEIPESALIYDARAEAFTRRLKAYGYGVALDDFGAGYTSIAHLRSLHLDSVKLDGSLIKRLKGSETDQTILRAVLDMLHALGKRVTAEMVEDEETLKILHRMGSDSAQGFHLGRPRPIKELRVQLDQERQGRGQSRVVA